jgi:hypothetical protein
MERLCAEEDDMTPPPPAGQRPEDASGRTGVTFEVMYQGQPIGTSRLEGHDAAMGVAFGAFEPLPAYQAVRPLFLLFTEAEEARRRGEAALAEEQLAAYYQARDALQLTLQTAEGHVVPASAIHIADWGDLGREVEVHISDPVFWQEHHLG